jgi:hypothetical protein
MKWPVTNVEVTPIADESVSNRVSGALEVELQLERNGWHPVRLGTAQMPSNADLLAVNKRQRVSIQIKTTDAEKKHSHSEWLFFGYSTGYIRDKKPIFNSKESPLIADVVIGVSYRATNPSFIVMPVAFAEALCRMHCDYWYGVPKKSKKGARSPSFPIYLCFTSARKTHTTHDERVKRNVLAFQSRWDILSEPIDKLHNVREWPLLP